MFKITLTALAVTASLLSGCAYAAQLTTPTAYAPATVPVQGEWSRPGLTPEERTAAWNRHLQALSQPTAPALVRVPTPAPVVSAAPSYQSAWRDCSGPAGALSQIIAGNAGCLPPQPLPAYRAPLQCTPQPDGAGGWMMTCQ
jgi:hypothetical protein